MASYLEEGDEGGRLRSAVQEDCSAVQRETINLQHVHYCHNVQVLLFLLLAGGSLDFGIGTNSAPASRHKFIFWHRC